MLSEKIQPFMQTLAKKTEPVIVSHFANPDLKIEFKADETPVTHADRVAEKVMRDHIRKHFPKHGIIGEEYGEENPDAEFVWVLDPIDGTKSFAAGCPLFGTLIALLHEGQPIAGAINQPVLRQFCYGDGQRSLLNGREVKMRYTPQLKDAILLATDLRDVYRHQQGRPFEKLIESTALFRTWGDCYGYLLLAGGWADIMLDPILNPWDYMALMPIIRGAGGVITTWQGNDPLGGQSIVAASRYIHGRTIEILNERQESM